MAFDFADDGTSDDALMVLYANGDAQAARVLTTRHLPRVLAHAKRVLGGLAEAEDVAQEAMLRLWKQAGDWRQGEAKVSTWLYRVTANLCTDRLRRLRGVGLDEIAEPADETPSVATQMHGQARANALYAALRKMPERQAEAVTLRHIDGHSNPEIAEIMEISIEAVESLTARGKRNLASLLAGQKDSLGLK